MRTTFALATSTVLALALAACGSSSDSEDAADETVTEEATADEAGEVADGEDAGEAEEGATEAEAGEEETAEPAPAATPTPTATVAAAPATPPAAFTTCGVCHSTTAGQNGVGPSLAGVVGRRAGSVAGANYSPAMQGANLTWTEANLRRYLADPNAVVSGTLMPAPGLDQAEVNAVVNYLKTL